MNRFEILKREKEFLEKQLKENTRNKPTIKSVRSFDNTKYEELI